MNYHITGKSEMYNLLTMQVTKSAQITLKGQISKNTVLYIIYAAYDINIILMTAEKCGREMWQRNKSFGTCKKDIHCWF